MEFWYPSLVETVALLERFHGQLSPTLYILATAGIAIETAILAWRGGPRDKRSRWLGIRCGALSFGIGGLFSTLVLVTAQTWVYQHRLLDLGLGPAAWIVCFVANDLMYYFSHRLQHEVRFLWCIHIVHHSSRHYDLTAGVRGSMFDGLVRFPFYVWIPILGIHPIIFVILETTFRFYGLAYHTEAIGKLGVVDGILVTPSNHRVHHGSNPKYLGCNYGGFCILFDRLLGTFRREDERPTYGLTSSWHGYQLMDCQLHALRDLWRDVKSARGLRRCIRIVVGPP